jgi:hypothetical protein
MISPLSPLTILLQLIRRPLGLGLFVALALLGTAACTDEDIAALSLLKQLDRVEAGFAFDVTLNNDTDMTFEGITVTEDMPSLLGYDSFSADSGTVEEDDDGALTWRLDSLAPGESVLLQILAFCTELGDFVNEVVLGYSGLDEPITASASGNCDYTRDGANGAAGAKAIHLESIILGVLHGTSTSNILSRLCFGYDNPVAGAKVEASLTGTAVIDSTASGTTGADGCTDLTFGISQVGSYTVTLDSVSGPEGTEYDPDAQDVETSASIEVTGEEQPLP